MTGAMTNAMAPVAAEIIAGLPPRNAMDTAIVNDANSPTRGSTPAMIEKEMASGISASATTRPARTSVRNIFGDRRAFMTEGSGGAVSGRPPCGRCGVAVLKTGGSKFGGCMSPPLREDGVDEPGLGELGACHRARHVACVPTLVGGSLKRTLPLREGRVEIGQT